MWVTRDGNTSLLSNVTQTLGNLLVTTLRHDLTHIDLTAYRRKMGRYKVKPPRCIRDHNESFFLYAFDTLDSLRVSVPMHCGSCCAVLQQQLVALHGDSIDVLLVESSPHLTRCLEAGKVLCHVVVLASRRCKLVESNNDSREEERVPPEWSEESV